VAELSQVVGELISRNGGLLIGVLEDVQDRYSYLSEDALREVSKRLRIPLRDVYGVATFYRAFKLKPCGKYLINVCLGTACHVRRATGVLETIRRELNVEVGETTEDMKFTLETVNCLGACALGPIMVVGGKYYGQMTPQKVKKVLKEYA
jgi:NADH-quinone oxidoreductase subunit E